MGDLFTGRTVRVDSSCPGWNDHIEEQGPAAVDEAGTGSARSGGAVDGRKLQTICPFGLQGRRHRCMAPGRRQHVAVDKDASASGPAWRRAVLVPYAEGTLRFDH